MPAHYDASASGKYCCCLRPKETLSPRMRHGSLCRSATSLSNECEAMRVGLQVSRRWRLRNCEILTEPYPAWKGTLTTLTILEDGRPLLGSR